MNVWIMLLGPSVLALDVYRRNNYLKREKLDYLFTFGTFLVLINAISYFIISVYYKNVPITFSLLVDDVTFNFRYLIMSTVVGVFVAYLYAIMENLLTVKIKGLKGKK